MAKVAGIWELVGVTSWGLNAKVQESIPTFTVSVLFFHQVIKD
jgi:hypothetical protein